ncbi:Large cysteine-rich periplasmic protein OmcB precursor [Novipirellula galeiformis]|uniref:Large cysteine-rich periplasmic protein OmcB n=1 Tax=Novipirellula galeiformis TaxID=2528004 RepID=A0A5C6C7L7_9BACT|nr:DUF11 domain-containing protein [Novipirellula galeiformis]TWU20148.1 Large cysteine-rich periplasmic protein OmcB precursor [Novipirellula galeiformis]
MKPFGVRLAAGAVTILLGALAAAQAQKDRSDRHESDWTLSASSMPSQLPAPLVGIEADANQEYADNSGAAGPSSLLARMPSGSLSNAEPIHSSQANASGGVAQVQYTEPAAAAPESMPLPASLGAAPVDTPSFDAAGIQGDGFAGADPQTNPEPGAGTEAPQRDAPSFDPGGFTPPGFDPNVAASPAAAPTQMQTPENAGIGLPSGPAFSAAAPMESPDSGNVAADAANNDTRNNDTLNNGSVATMGLPTAAMPPSTAGPQTFAAPTDAAGGPSSFSGEPSNFSGEPSNMLRGSGADVAANHDAPVADNAAQNDFAQPNFAAQSPAPQATANMEQPPAYGQNEYGPATAMPAADMNAMPTTASSPAANSPATNYPATNYPAESPQTYGGNDSFAGNPVANERIASRTSQPGMMGTDQRVPKAAPQQFDDPIAAQPVRVNPNTTLASPGDRHLEGVQSPSIVIQKRAPSEVKVGKPASFVIHVQNVGSVEALDVQIHDRVPQGMRLVDASPLPEQQGEILVWNLGPMPAGDERTVTMQLVPEQEGELGSVARVTFEAAASVRTISTRPELRVVQRAPEQVLIGQQLEIEVEVSNPGTGSATGVVVQEDVPDGLEHPKGKQLDNLLGDLAPGETRQQVLRMRAVAPGKIQNTIRLVADDGLTTEHTVNVEIVAPELQIALAGPARRFLERPATFQLEIVNGGTADATNVEIKAQLDRGFTFVSTDFEGQYDPTQHTVSWYLESLPKGGRGQVPLTLLPVEEGNRKISLDARADLGVIAKSESAVAVDSLAELTFQISDSADPIEVGSESIYEIRVKNSGSRDDSNVRVQLQLPAGIERIASDGDAQEDGRGGLFFAPKPVLASNGELVYRVRVRGVAEGTHIVKAIVTSDQSAVPVTKEESTMVYADR